MTTYLLERAWLGSGAAGSVVDDVEVEVSDGTITRVDRGGSSPTADPAMERLAGLTLPGIANCHSHAFHRALRGRTQRERGTFWTWRDRMYDVAAGLDPDTYYALALATYAEMRAAGFTAVGEFHYLHHERDGTPYADPNEMGHALVRAAREAGIRITLLDTCYLSSGFGEPPRETQVRYWDGDAAGWADRFAALAATYDGADDVRIGAAIHSVRAVPADQLPEVVAAAAGRPLHVHLSEQVAENEACLAAHGRTPTALLAEAGALGPLTSAVHATHLTAADIALLGDSGTSACFCPTTERDLGDGIGPARELLDAGSSLTVGTDSHAVVDAFEELRAVELDARLAAQQRGLIGAGELLDAGTVAGHRSLALPAGSIEVGAPADLVTIDTTTPRTAGTGADEHTAVFAATGADVSQVMVAGRVRTADPERARALADELETAVRKVLS